MKNRRRLVIITAVLFNAITASAAEIATATITSSQIDASDFQYSLVLNDIGTTNIGTFWFAWIPGEDFMAASPVNILSPANWTSTVTGGGTNDGFAIRWQAQAGFALTPGNSLSGFGFESATTPAQMAGLSQFFAHPHVTTSVIYSAGPFSDAGSTFIATPVPEPSMIVPLLIAGGFVLRWRYTKRGIVMARRNVLMAPTSKLISLAGKNSGVINHREKRAAQRAAAQREVTTAKLSLEPVSKAQ